MNDTTPPAPPSVQDGKPAGFLGGVPFVLLAGGVVALGVAGWWFLPSARDNAANRVQAEERIRAAGAMGQPWAPPPLQPVAQPRPPMMMPAAQERPSLDDRPQGQQRARATSMVGYARPAPPPTAAASNGRLGAAEEAQTVAGMTVLRAQTLADARHYLMPGDKIACLNLEPITERTGAAFSAIIPDNIYGREGPAGGPPLIPKGSRAVGKVLRGLDNGERRLAAVLTHIEGPTTPGRPTMFVPLGNAAAGDALGQVDLEGNIETHFWSRLGAVAAYAGLDMVAGIGSSVAGAAISDAVQGNGRGGGVSVNNFGGMGNGRGLAGRAFDHEIQKQPTFRRPQSQPCTIFINQPIDFRSVAR